jgi:hypothetical protein
MLSSPKGRAVVLAGITSNMGLNRAFCRNKIRLRA